MIQSQLIMGMPITIEIADPSATDGIFGLVFNYFRAVDERFSTYKENSEISSINQGRLDWQKSSPEMKEVFKLSELTRKQTGGFFDILTPQKKYDLSGLVKGWAINKAAQIISYAGYKNFYIDAGGDVQVSGKNALGEPWSIGIRNPFNSREIIKVVFAENEGVATSGTYIRGQHIYDPFNPRTPIIDIVSLTVVGPNIYEADRFATAAFAMRKSGIRFIELQPGLEGYMVDSGGTATMTSGFAKYTKAKSKTQISNAK